MTRLEALNQMLVAIGEAPVSTEASQHPDMLIARHIFDREIEAIQNKGWWFNTDTSIDLSPDLDGHIIIPSTALKIDPVNTYLHYVQRGTKLYNQDTSSYVFEDSVSVCMVFKLPFDELPIAAQNYITDVAAYKLHNSTVGDDKKLSHLAKFVAESYRVLNTEELSAGDYNAKRTPSALRMLAGIRPYRSGY